MTQQEDTMPSFLDFVVRAPTGPIMSEDDSNMKVLIPKVRTMAPDSGIRHDPENPVPAGDDFADRLFEASIAFPARTGVYCDDTSRAIHLEKDGIRQAAASLHEGGTSGKGRDRRKFRARKPEDDRPPWYHVGTRIVASSEEIATAQVESYGCIPQAKPVGIPALGRLPGMPIVGGSPLEIGVTVAFRQAGRKHLGKCGQPRPPILNLISSATTSAANIAGSHPALGLRPGKNALTKRLQPFGIHHCGDNLQHVSKACAQVPGLAHVDVGWGSAVATCRAALLDALFSLRLNSARLRNQTPAEVQADVGQLLDHGGPWDKLALCSVAMDAGTPDENVRAVFEVAERYRRRWQ